MTRQFPPLEQRGTRDSLLSLTKLSGHSVLATGPVISGVWLKSQNGSVRYMGVDDRTLLPKFEVFTLAIETLGELQARWRAWEPFPVPEDRLYTLRCLGT